MAKPAIDVAREHRVDGGRQLETRGRAGDDFDEFVLVPRGHKPQIKVHHPGEAPLVPAEKTRRLGGLREHGIDGIGGLFGEAMARKTRC